MPNVTASPNLVKLLTVDFTEIAGGILDVDTDPVKATEAMLAHIEGKRKKLCIEYWKLGECSAGPNRFMGAVLDSGSLKIFSLGIKGERGKPCSGNA